MWHCVCTKHPRSMVIIIYPKRQPSTMGKCNQEQGLPSESWLRVDWERTQTKGTASDWEGSHRDACGAAHQHDVVHAVLGDLGVAQNLFHRLRSKDKNARVNGSSTFQPLKYPGTGWHRRPLAEWHRQTILGSLIIWDEFIMCTETRCTREGR